MIVYFLVMNIIRCTKFLFWKRWTEVLLRFTAEAYLFLKKIKIDDVLKVILYLNGSKASGSEKRSSMPIKGMNPVTAPSLSIIFNSSLSAGMFQMVGLTTYSELRRCWDTVRWFSISPSPFIVLL